MLLPKLTPIFPAANFPLKYSNLEYFTQNQISIGRTYVNWGFYHLADQLGDQGHHLFFSRRLAFGNQKRQRSWCDNR